MIKFITGKMPDITPAQVMAVIIFITSQAVAWGWMSNATNQKFLATCGTVVAVVLKIVDSYLRSSRVKVLAAAGHFPPGPPNQAPPVVQ